MSDVHNVNVQHPKSLLVTLLRLLCRPSIGEDDSNGYLDVHLVCRDGVVGVRITMFNINFQAGMHSLFVPWAPGGI